MNIYYVIAVYGAWGSFFFILKISTSVGLQTRSMDATKELASTQLAASSAIAYRVTWDSSANQVCFRFSYNSPFAFLYSIISFRKINAPL